MGLSAIIMLSPITENYRTMLESVYGVNIGFVIMMLTMSGFMGVSWVYLNIIDTLFYPNSKEKEELNKKIKQIRKERNEMRDKSYIFEDLVRLEYKMDAKMRKLKHGK
jgi:hypothetical protein